jgi:hypothetical protein
LNRTVHHFVIIDWTVEKLLKGVLFSRKFPYCSPITNFEKFLKFLCVSACRAESIGILFVKICSLVKKLFWGYFSQKVSPCCSPSVKFGTFLNIRLLPSLSTWTYWYVDSKNRSNGWKVIQEGILFTRIAPLLPRMKFWEFWWFHFVPLVLLNRSVYTCENRSNGWKASCGISTRRKTRKLNPVDSKQ